MLRCNRGLVEGILTVEVYGTVDSLKHMEGSALEVVLVWMAKLLVVQDVVKFWCW